MNNQQPAPAPALGWESEELQAILRRIKEADGWISPAYSRFAFPLADALCHEHDLRLRAEDIAHGFNLIAQGAKPLQDQLAAAQQRIAELEKVVRQHITDLRACAKLLLDYPVFNATMGQFSQAADELAAALSPSPAQPEGSNL